jgi:hypothetical protein
MTDVEAIPTTYHEAVRTLAGWHAGTDLADLEIYSFPDPEELTVRLIEVSEGFPRTGRVVPVTFGRSREFPFRSSAALLTPDEWQQVLSGTLPLPEGWTLERRQRVWPDGGA